MIFVVFEMSRTDFCQGKIFFLKWRPSLWRLVRLKKLILLTVTQPKKLRDKQSFENFSTKS